MPAIFVRSCGGRIVGNTRASRSVCDSVPASTIPSSTYSQRACRSAGFSSGLYSPGERRTAAITADSETVSSPTDLSK